MITEWIAGHRAWVGVFIGFPLGAVSAVFLLSLCHMGARDDDVAPSCSNCPMLACFEDSSEIVDGAERHDLPAISPGSSGGPNA